MGRGFLLMGFQRFEHQLLVTGYLVATFYLILSKDGVNHITVNIR